MKGVENGISQVPDSVRLLHSVLSQNISATEDVKKKDGCGTISTIIEWEKDRAFALASVLKKLITLGVDINAETKFTWSKFNTKGGYDRVTEVLTPIETVMRHYGNFKTAWTRHSQFETEEGIASYNMVKILLDNGAKIPDRMVDSEYATSDIKIQFAKQQMEAGTTDATKLLQREIEKSKGEPNKSYIEYLIEKGAKVSDREVATVTSADARTIEEKYHYYDIKSILAKLELAHSEQKGENVVDAATSILTKQLHEYLDSKKRRLSCDSVNFLISKGARADERLLNQVGECDDGELGFPPEKAVSELYIALMKQKISENSGAINDVDGNGHNALDKAVRHGMKATEETLFYQALVETKDIARAAEQSGKELFYYIKEDAEEKYLEAADNGSKRPNKKAVEIADIDLKYVQDWNRIIETGDYKKTYHLRVSDQYIKFLLDNGAKVSKDTHDLMVESLGKDYDSGTFAKHYEMNKKTGRNEPFRLVAAIEDAYKAQNKNVLVEPRKRDDEPWSISHGTSDTGWKIGR